MRTSGLMADLLTPSPERLARSLEISITCMLVVLISMTFEIPDPATSTYLIFFTRGGYLEQVSSYCRDGAGTRSRCAAGKGKNLCPRLRAVCGDDFLASW